MVIKCYLHLTAKSFWDSQTSSPRSDADWTTWEDLGSGGGGVCVVRGGGGMKPFQN